MGSNLRQARGRGFYHCFAFGIISSKKSTISWPYRPPGPANSRPEDKLRPVPTAAMGPDLRRDDKRGVSANLPLTMLVLLLLALTALPAAADSQRAGGPPQSPSAKETVPPSAQADAETYSHCMTLARQEPHAALSFAEAWGRRGGAHPADHCIAVALISLGKYKDGATRLQALAQAMTTAPAGLLAGVLDQASQAWLLAGDPTRAFEVAREAAAVAPGDPDIIIDRAEAAAAAGYLDAAVADLDRVLKADPNQVDALIYRASADRKLDRLERARADIDKAVGLAPHSAAALLERGNIRRLQGDSDGARSDWEEVDQIAPGSPEDTAARANIEHLSQPPDGVTPATQVTKARAR
jgi:tetratricopeptide (TPR) repeat protein